MTLSFRSRLNLAGLIIDIPMIVLTGDTISPSAILRTRDAFDPTFLAPWRQWPNALLKHIFQKLWFITVSYGPIRRFDTMDLDFVPETAIMGRFYIHFGARKELGGR
jgi:hypothetical protein